MTFEASTFAIARGRAHDTQPTAPPSYPQSQAAQNNHPSCSGLPTELPPKYSIIPKHTPRPTSLLSIFIYEDLYVLSIISGTVKLQNFDNMDDIRSWMKVLERFAIAQEDRNQKCRLEVVKSINKGDSTAAIYSHLDEAEYELEACTREVLETVSGHMREYMRYVWLNAFYKEDPPFNVSQLTLYSAPASPRVLPVQIDVPRLRKRPQAAAVPDSASKSTPDTATHSVRRTSLDGLTRMEMFSSRSAARKAAVDVLQEMDMLLTGGVWNSLETLRTDCQTLYSDRIIELGEGGEDAAMEEVCALLRGRVVTMRMCLKTKLSSLRTQFQDVVSIPSSLLRTFTDTGRMLHKLPWCSSLRCWPTLLSIAPNSPTIQGGG